MTLEERVEQLEKRIAELESKPVQHIKEIKIISKDTSSDISQKIDVGRMIKNSKALCW